MRIQHNIAALNSYRQLNSNNNAVSKNLEKLSSGYSINRAGDDAAGLAISEKMRSQIAGLEAAQKNSNDGISLIQTAEGNLQEVHSMLNRMVELATMSANGTYGDTNRAQYQKEIDALNEEIDRIAQSANFNGKKLLDGSLSTKTTNVEAKAMSDVAALGEKVGIGETVSAANYTGTQTVLHKNASGNNATSFEIDFGHVDYKNVAGGEDAITITIAGSGSAKATVSFNGTADVVGKVGEAFVNAVKDANGAETISIGNAVYKVEAQGNKVVFTMDNANELTEVADFNGNFSVTVGFTPDSTTPGSMSVSNLNFGTENVIEGEPTAGEVLATASFELNAADFADGAALKIGDETYVFAQNQETLDGLKNNGNVVVVDLVQEAKDLKAGNITEDQMKDAAINKLSQAAVGNKMFGVGHGATTGTVTVQEKSTYSGGADLTTEKGLNAQLQKFATGELVSISAVEAGDALVLQVGDTNDSYQKMSISIDATDSKSLGVANVDVSTEQGAGNAIAAINAAIDKVSDIRAGLGALQNRLDHTINNLGVATENITAAESRIRDTDMAKEMMTFTKNNILVQSAQAMLAQANMLPQSVLQLLQ